MSDWRPTAALARGLLTGGLAALAAVAFGRPDLWVLGAPLLVSGVAAVLSRPSSEDPPPPAPVVAVDHRTLHEGQGSNVRTTVQRLRGAEQLTRTFDDTPFVVRRSPGAVSVACDPREGTHRVSTPIGVRRWGTREVGAGTVAANGPWGGWRWGPVRVPGSPVTALPSTVAFSSRAQAPHPIGLVGAHQSVRVGDGSEFAGIRPFAVGDRLRRINWRVSLATGNLHVVETRADQDTAVLLLVDGLADVGKSGGLDGPSSSLDLTVRAAAALAEHHLRTGDRVGLRPLGAVDVSALGFGVGAAHRVRILHSLARLGRGRVDTEGATGRMRLRAPEGTVVLMLTPMLHPLAANVAATVARSGLPLVVVDTLPADLEQRGDNAPSRAVADTVWRLRMLERDMVLAEVARVGCPVVAWRGPGTLDDVMRRLSRRARLPRAVTR